MAHALEDSAGGRVGAQDDLGPVLSQRGNLEEEAALYREALRINPNHIQLRNNPDLLLGDREARGGSGPIPRSDANPSRFRRGIDARAMILSVCPEAKCRDGPKAVESATRAD